MKVIRLSPVAWQYINLIGIYEFYSKKECLNLHEVIEKLIANKKINLLATAYAGKFRLFPQRTQVEVLGYRF